MCGGEWVGGFAGMGGLVSDRGRRSLCLLAFARRGMDRQMFMCVCGSACVLRGMHFACV